MQHLAIYLDMDGVLADFDAGLKALGIAVDPALNKPSEELTPEERAAKHAVRDRIANSGFYRTLPLMAGARELWNFVAPAAPIVLTAAPRFADGGEHGEAFRQAALDKRAWIEAMFGPVPDERFVCTTSSGKARFMHRKHSAHQILVDDRISNILPWREAGGIGIHHVSAGESIAQIAALLAA